MGQAKRRGTFEQRKAQRLASQYGMTNHEIAIAYQMNRVHLLRRLQETQPFRLRNAISRILNYHI